LRTLECEKTHFLKLPLEDGAGSLSLLITITGRFESFSYDNEISENDIFADNTNKNEIIQKYVKV
jgi:hypothetical protein